MPSIVTYLEVIFLWKHKTRTVKGLIKKHFTGKKKLIIGLTALSFISTVTALIIALILYYSCLALLNSATLPVSTIFNKEETDESSISCCGCKWIPDINNTVQVQVPSTSTGNSALGNNNVTSNTTGIGSSNSNVYKLSDLKLLGKATISYYTRQVGSSVNFDKDTGEPVTSTGAFATAGYTVAPASDLRQRLGLKDGDWVYIDKVGVRQIQDKCGVGGRLDVFTDHMYSEMFNNTNIKDMDIYFICSGTVKKGWQTDVKPPIVLGGVTESEGVYAGHTPESLAGGSATVTVPSYGYGTGSLTNTSISLPVWSKHPDTTEKLIDSLISGAVVTYQLYGIYPSVTIGQKIQESGWKYTTSIKNNFFGIKADSSWTGEKGLYTTKEVKNNVTYTVKAYFRHYNTPEEGILDHGAFFVKNQRYTKAGVFNAKNGREQIQAIKNAGYATDPKYVSQIHGHMDTAQLDWFDDLNNSLYYMQQKGLYQNYLNFVALAKSGQVKLAQGAKLENLNQFTGGSITNNNTSTGRWECTCKEGCPDCICPKGKNNNSNSTTNNSTGNNNNSNNNTNNSNNNTNSNTGNTNNSTGGSPTMETAPVDPLPNYIITSNFYRDSGKCHGAVDFGVAGNVIGTPVHAIYSGTVYKVGGGSMPDTGGVKRSYGNHIIIQHSDGTYALYAHLQQNSIKVKVGDVVQQGQVIGGMGNSGDSYGAHLHLEFIWTLSPQKIVSSVKPLLNGHSKDELAQYVYSSWSEVKSGLY